MNEGDPRIVRAALRCFVDEAHTRSLQPLQCLFNVIHAHGNMMKAFAPFRHEFFNGRVGPRRLKQLDAAFSDGQHRYAHSLLVDLVISVKLQANGLFVHFHGFGDRLHCNSDVVDLHHGLPNFTFLTIFSTIE